MKQVYVLTLASKAKGYSMRNTRHFESLEGCWAHLTDKGSSFWNLIEEEDPEMGPLLDQALPGSYQEFEVRFRASPRMEGCLLATVPPMTLRVKGRDLFP